MQSFIQKYKPYYIDDFYFDTAKKQVIKSLLLDLKTNMLFVGEAATGKTTFLYALLRESYGLGPHDRCGEHDVLFINNLKEQQGISYFRNEMKTFCQTRSVGRKKMIVIDDIETIHQQCQQVLCNYIDKYSGNIQFLFTCGNQQKIIENIQSRVQILLLEPPERQHLEGLYRRMIKEERLASRVAEGEAEVVERFVVDLAQNSLRELVNILEKMGVFFGSPGPSSDGEKEPITLKQLQDLFQTRIQTSFQELIGVLRRNELHEGIQCMLGIVANGYSIVDIFDAFFKFVKGTDLLNEGEKYDTIKVLCQYITIIHTVHEETIEIILFTNALSKVLGNYKVVLTKDIGKAVGI